MHAAASSETQRGFTLIELMISLVLFSLAMAGLLSVGVSITQGYREQRSAIAAESAVRVPLDFLADALRQASPGVPVPANVQDAGTCSTGAITVTNGSSGSDELDLIYASGAIVTSSRVVYDSGTTSLDVNDASQLAAGDHVIITNFSTGHLVEITDVSGDTLTLAAQCGGINLPSGGYPIGSAVIRAQHARFYIADLDGYPTLWMDPDSDGPAEAEPLAEGIEDMQIAIGIDADGINGINDEVGAAANDDEWSYNFAGDSAPTGTIRAVRLTLVARSLVPLIGNVALFSRPTAEDRAAGTADAYRRRALRTIVDMRNIEGSP